MSSPTHNFCVGQIRRLSGLNFFPKEREAIRELVRTLERVGHTDDHAERIIDYWIENNSDRPTVRDLITTAGIVAICAPEKMPERCQACFESDWITDEKNGISAAARCICPRGQALRTRDRLSLDTRAAARERGNNVGN